MEQRDPQSHRKALDRRAHEMLDAALADKEFMDQLQESVEEVKRGGRGVPLREIRRQQKGE